MRRGVSIGVAFGGLLLTLACDWEEFHACEGDECVTMTGGGTTATTGAGGAGGAAGAGGSTAGGSSSGGVGTAATGEGGTTGSGGSTTGGGEGGDPGVGGAAGAGGSPAMCDGELLPGDDACVVDEEYGVFVSPGGDDATGDGTREAPFATLQKAADAASETGKRVYACATGGDYAAALSLAEAHDGLELYGSFDCSDWGYDGDLRANVAPDAGVVLRVNEIATSLQLDGFAFESADATTPGTSSIAAEIRGSSGVVLRNVGLRAGAGEVGTAGETGRFTHPEKSLLEGVDGTEESAGVSSIIDCPAGDQTRGGVGGFPEEPTDGLRGAPDHDGDGGEGGVVGETCVGQEGADGPDGPDGPGATTRGAVVNGNWVPASGTDGSPGLPGQGGGGGAGGLSGGGGSGGAGGCGLAGGAAGGGGGASIALFMIDAEVALIDSDVAAGDGGYGGPAGLAERRAPEFGSPGLGFDDGCDGGSGGQGGAGGGGGGGAGGISVGILFQGPRPTRTNTSVIAGNEGEGGGGAGVDNDGVDGFSEPEFDVADL